MRTKNKVILKAAQWFFCNDVYEGNIPYRYKIIELRGFNGGLFEKCTPDLKQCWDRLGIAFFWDLKSFFSFLYYRFIKRFIYESK